MSHTPGEDDLEDEEHEDAPELGEGWDPEDDNLQKNYMKMAAKFMREQLKSLEELKETRKEERAHVREHAITPGRLSQSLSGMIALGGSGAPNVQVRKIDNGFLMTYNEVKEDSASSHAHGAPGVGGSPFAAPMATVPKVGPPHVHRVEIFVKDASEALPHLQRAMDSLEKISKMGPGAFYL